MLIDRLDWVDGWPAVRAGRGPSERRAAGPGDRRPLVDGVRLRRAGPLARRPARGPSDSEHADRRLRAARGAAAHAAQRRRSARPPGSRPTCARPGPRTGSACGPARRPCGRSIDPDGRHAAAAAAAARARGPVDQRCALPAGFARRRLALGRRSRCATASPRPSSRTPGSATRSPASTLDLHGQHRRRSSGPARSPRGRASTSTTSARCRGQAGHRSSPRRRSPTGSTARPSDEFSGSTLGPGWSWVRKDDAATVDRRRAALADRGGRPGGTGNDAGVLLRSPGAGRLDGRDQGRPSTSAPTTSATSSRRGSSRTSTTTSSPGSATWRSGTPGRPSSATRCRTPAGWPTAARSSGRRPRPRGCGSRTGVDPAQRRARAAGVDQPGRQDVGQGRRLDAARRLRRPGRAGLARRRRGDREVRLLPASTADRRADLFAV